MSYEEVGENVEYKLSTDKKTVTVKFPIDGEPYGESDKTKKLATTRGNIRIKGAPDTVRFSVNCFDYKPRPKKVKKEEE